jgi:hypothetical protein
MLCRSRLLSKGVEERWERYAVVLVIKGKGSKRSLTYHVVECAPLGVDYHYPTTGRRRVVNQFPDIGCLRRC